MQALLAAQLRGVSMFTFPKWRLFDADRQRLRTLYLNHPIADVAGDLAEVPGGTVSLVCVGDLTPGSASADLLECAALWVEGAQGRSMNISWVGDGDLRGVLAAQPLPEALSQRFLGVSSGADAVHADVLCLMQHIDVSPYLKDAHPAADAAVLVAGRCRQIAGALRHPRSVWHFDERRPATLMAGLESALETIFARRLRRNTAEPKDCRVCA